MRIKTFLLTALFALIFSHPASAAEKLRVGFSVIGVASSPSWVAVEKGLWKKYGLDVELILLSGGTRSVPALVQESFQVFSRYFRNADIATMAYLYDEISDRVARELRPNPESIRFLIELVALDTPKAKQLTEKDHSDLTLRWASLLL